MPPDVNSLPASPRQDRAQPVQTSRTSSETSRRASQQMPPPPAPASAPGQYPPPQRSPELISNEQTGPVRHPRPLTAAELYLECEKEQEAVVNRLTRELTELRAQTASVASNASQSSTSTSASLLPVDISDPNPTHQLTGATHPTPSRRHRSSSSLSTRSIPNTPSTSVSQSGSGTTNMSTQVQTGSTVHVPLGGQSQASADRAAAAGNLSRQPSVSASGTSTPARQSMDSTRHASGVSYRPSLSRDPSYTSHSNTAPHAAHTGPTMPLSPTQSITSQHYAETVAYRNEMEAVKAENEALRQRVRALEHALRARRRDSSNSDAARSDPSSARRDPRDALPRDPREAGSLNVNSPVLVSPEPRSAVSPGIAAWAADGGVGGVAPPRERSESQSTTASSRRGIMAEDDVRLGESAGSVGIGRGQ